MVKGTDAFTPNDIKATIEAHSDVRFTLSNPSINTYTVHYIGDAAFADHIFHLTEEQKLLAQLYASNLELFLHGSHFGSISAQVSQDVLQYSVLIEKLEGI